MSLMEYGDFFLISINLGHTAVQASKIESKDSNKW